MARRKMRGHRLFRVRRSHSVRRDVRRHGIIKRNMPKDAHILVPISVRLPSDVVSEARQRGEYVRGGASQVLRNWLLLGKSKDASFSRGMYDAPIRKKTK